MFDLFRSREKAVRYLIGALLGLVALSLVITLIPGYGSTSGSSREQVVAEIGGQPLTVREVSATLQMALRNRQVPQEMLQFYLPQVIDQMITERAVAYQAKRMGFKITDEEVANAIRSMLMQYFPNGDIPPDQYRRFLQQQGQDVDRFEANVRLNLQMLRLQNMALEGALVAPDEVEQEFHRKNDKIKVQYVKYTPPADLKSKVTVTPDEIKAYYNSQKAQFTVPEKRSLNILVADEAKIGASLEVPEQQLRSLYNAQIDRFKTGERVHARHILIKTGDKAEAKANDILKQLRGGADFAELAKKNSEDPGSATRGGDLDWFGRGQMVPPFDAAAFTLKPKEISNLVKSDFGYHIIQVLEKEPAKTKTFEEVKGQLAADSRREVVQQKMQQAIDQAQKDLTKAPNSAQEIANRLGLTYVHVEKLGPSDSIPELGSAAEVDAATAGARVGQVSQVFQIGQNRLAVAAVTQVFPTHPAELAEVENQVRDRLVAQKLSQLTEEKIKEASDRMKAANGDLNALAKQLGTSVKDADYFTVDTAAEGIGPGNYLAEGFTKPVGAVVGPFNIGGELFLAKTTDKQVASPTELASKRDELVLDLKRRRASLRKELFEDGLLNQLIKEGKVKKNNDTINRILASYRG